MIYIQQKNYYTIFFPNLNLSPEKVRRPCQMFPRQVEHFKKLEEIFPNETQVCGKNSVVFLLSMFLICLDNNIGMRFSLDGENDIRMRFTKNM